MCYYCTYISASENFEGGTIYGVRLVESAVNRLCACNILGWVVLFAVRHIKQYYIWKLCRYSGTGEKPGAACVICAYHHDCNRARQSTEYRQYSYCRRVLPNTAKELFDKIWEEERGPRPK